MSEESAFNNNSVEDSANSDANISGTEEDTSSSSIQESYRINDSESDDDDELDDDDYSQSQDLLELKEQTKNLLDTKWKEDRDLHLLNKMLELEEPSISAKMVDFLLQPGVCQSLTDFITQVGSSRRPYPHESSSTELKFSYRATMLLSVDEPSDALLLFLSKKARVIAKCMFDIFRDDSAGSFYHAARVIESLLRVYPGEVYAGMAADGMLDERMSAILRHVGYPPVGDLVVILVALTPVPRSSPVYSSCSKSRYSFFNGLSKWSFMLRLAQIIVNPSEHCRVDEYITPEQHCSAAAQTFNELVEKLSSEDISTVLLQILGSSPELLKGFVDRATGMKDGVRDEAAAALEVSDPDLYLTSRQASLHLLSFLMKKSSNAQNVCFIMGLQGQPVQTLVPNRLYPLRPMLVAYLATRVEDLQSVMVQSKASEASEGGEDGEEGDQSSSVVHPGHICKTPFSSYRSQLVQLFVLLVEASTTAVLDDSDEGCTDFCEKVPVDLWKCLIAWVFEYAHNNIYHTMFYRILFAVLRQNNETCLRNIFKNCRLVTYLIDAFEPFEEAFEKEYEESHDITMGDKHSERLIRLSLKDRNALRGLLINSCNAIRLQVSCLPPTSFLRNYLHSHSAWNEFLPSLRMDTLVQQPSGLGSYVPSPESRPGANYISALMSLQKPDGEGIDHGSKYAKFLGFEEEIEWPEDNIGELKKKKKNKKKKKKSHHRRRTKSDMSDDDLELDLEDLELEINGSECLSDDDETDESENESERRISVSTDGTASSGEDESAETNSADVEQEKEQETTVTKDLDSVD